MDAARRWQVASSVTAVAGLSIGALMLGRTPSQPVETIDLDQLTVVDGSGEGSETIDDGMPIEQPRPSRPERAPREPSNPEIVQPRVREDRPSVAPTTAVPGGGSDSLDSPNSLDSPDSLDSD
jgi:hypothetical protein